MANRSKYTFAEVEEKLDIIKNNQGANKVLLGDGTYGDKPKDGENGINGKDGIGVAKIEKTATNDLVDTYTITFTDNTTSTFTVTNGKDGTNDSGSVSAEDISTAVQNYLTENPPSGVSNTDIENAITTYMETNAEDFKGEDGKDGKGITSIEKTSTSGLVDTYTITFTDTTTSTFTVTNGEDGAGGTGETVSVEDIANAVDAYMQENPVSAEVSDKSVTASKFSSDVFMTNYEYVDQNIVQADVTASNVSAIDEYKFKEILFNIPVEDLSTPYNVEVSWDSIESNGTQGNTNTSYGYKVVTLMAYLSDNEKTDATSLIGLTKYTMLSFVNQDYSNASATQEIATSSKFLKIGIRVAIWEDDTEYVVKNLKINVGGKTLNDVSNVGMFKDEGGVVTIGDGSVNETSPLILRKADIDYINNFSRFYGKKCLWFGDSLSATSSFKKTVDFIAEKMGIDITNVSVAGTGYALDGFGTAWYKRIDSTFDTKYDLVVIFGGGNDAMNETIVLGEFGDTTIDGTDDEGNATRNFYAALDSMYSQIKAKYLLKDVLIINPLPMQSVDNEAMESYADAIVKMANKYKMPVLDLFHECYYNVDNSTFVNEYTVNSDGIHPTEKYHKEKIANKVIAKLKSI